MKRSSELSSRGFEFVPSYHLRVCPYGKPTEDHIVGDYDDIPPRIPTIGEQIVGPDDYGIFWVHEVLFEYKSGFALPPYVMVIARHNRPIIHSADVVPGAI